jgi:hypothetical protein
MKTIYLSLLVALMLTGCSGAGTFGGGSGSGSSTLAKTTNINYSQAKALYIAPQSTTVSSLDLFFTRMKTSLFDLTAFADNTDVSQDGLFMYITNPETQITSLEPVTLTTAGSADVLGVYDTLNYTLMRTVSVYDENGVECGLIAISKSDSTTTCLYDTLTNSGPTLNAFYQTDSTGNHIFFVNKDVLIHLDMTNPENPVQTVVTTIAAPTPQGIQFAVNPAGDIAVEVDSGYNGGQGPMSIIPLGGSAQAIGTAQFGTMLSIPGTNNFFFDNSDDNNSICGSEFCVATKSGNSFSVAAVGFVMPECLSGEACASVNVGTTMVMADAPQAGLSWFFTSSGTVRMYTAGSCPGGQTCISTNWSGNNVDKIVGIQGGNGNVFVETNDYSGNTGLYSYNVTGATFTTLVSPGSYAISTYTVDNSGNVTFSGTRESDGAIVMATIAAGSSTVVIQSDTLSATVTQISAIN